MKYEVSETNALRRKLWTKSVIQYIRKLQLSHITNILFSVMFMIPTMNSKMRLIKYHGTQCLSVAEERCMQKRKKILFPYFIFKFEDFVNIFRWNAMRKTNAIDFSKDYLALTFFYIFETKKYTILKRHPFSKWSLYDLYLWDTFEAFFLYWSNLIARPAWIDK